MGDVETKLAEIYLQPGEVRLARRPSILRTVLGSCVGVTFWSPRLSIGALCHGVLPRCPPGMQGPGGYYYVDFAICELVGQFDDLGISCGDVHVKVFGGADVSGLGERRTRRSVGSQNRQTALEVLAHHNLTVIASDLGGTIGRSIRFHTGTGKVFVRRLEQFP